ncbi:MAG: hypothetical protein R6U19_05700 [Bacteroidales bacterium]
MTLKSAILFIIFLIPQMAISQDWTDKFSWWNQKHNWDGKTHWLKYLTLSPAYMGPNALPVPEIQNAGISKTPYLEYSNNYYFAPGDHTLDAHIKFVYPFKERVKITASIVPVEYFCLKDTLLRDERAIRHKHPRGITTGDLYMSTHIRILDKERWPQVVLGFAFKTASGGKTDMARYTDTPAYYFDVSFGHTLKFPGNIIERIRLYGMGGFYAYQTYNTLHRQNDAFLYGLGINMNLKNISLENKLGGYTGYQNLGDRPMVCRFKFNWHKKYVNWFLRYQYGLNDFPYQAIGFGLQWKLLKINK